MSTTKDSIIDGEKIIMSVNETSNTLLSRGENLNVKSGITVSVSNAYHISEIEQNNRIIKTASRIVWCGLAIICVGILCAITGKTEASVITVVAGIVSEFISAIIFGFVSMSNKSKLKYFEQLSLNEEGEQLLKIVSEMENKKVQEKQFDKMITNYCDRRK